jgi:hypothetical protein
VVFSVLPSTSDSLSDIFKIFLLNTLYIYLLNLQFLVKQELPTLPEHLSLSPVLVGFVLLDRLFYMYVLLIVVCPFVLFHLAIVLSVLVRYTDSDCPFGIFKLIF